MEMRDGKSGHYKLRDHVQEQNKHMWPSPSAQPPGWKTAVPVDKDGNRPEHPNQRFYDKKTGKLLQKGLEQVVKMYPTPRGTKIGGYSSPDFSPTLEQTIKNIWPTPSTRDFRSGKASDATMERNSRPLNEVVEHWPTPGTLTGNNSGRLDEYGGADNPLRGTDLGKGALNPDWVEWLMGFPIGWTDVGPPTAEESDLETDFRGGVEFWLQNLTFWWERDPADVNLIPRITEKKTNRVNRLKALGNAQVPLCAAIAWILLRGDL